MEIPQDIQSKEEETIIVADEDETTTIEKMLKGKEVVKDVAITQNIEKEHKDIATFMEIKWLETRN